VANNRKQRSQKIIKFIQLMDFLKQHKNFNGVMQIYSALNTAAVLRLKKLGGMYPVDGQRRIII